MMEINSPAATEKEIASKAIVRIATRSRASKSFVTFFTVSDEPSVATAPAKVSTIL
jgi:hypothetical protein